MAKPEPGGHPRTGLSRTDAATRAIGTAAVLQAVAPQARVVLLTTARPGSGVMPPVMGPPVVGPPVLGPPVTRAPRRTCKSDDSL